MFRIFAPLVPVIALLTVMPGAATAADDPNSGSTTCVRYDQVVCSYELVDEAELAAGRELSFRSPAGLPDPDRIAIERNAAGRLMVVLFYPARADLQGVAQ